VPQLATVLYSHVLSALFICPHLFPFFFFSIIPRPPISTLFPYTTLFRSHPETRSLRYTLRKVRYAMCCSFSPSLVRASWGPRTRSEGHTSELQSRFDLVCRLLLEKKNTVQIDRRESSQNITHYGVQDRLV